MFKKLVFVVSAVGCIAYGFASTSSLAGAITIGKFKITTDNHKNTKKDTARKPASTASTKDTPAPAGGCYKFDFQKDKSGACVTKTEKDCKFAPKFASSGPCNQCLEKFGREMGQHQMAALQNMRGLNTCKKDWMVLDKVKTCAAGLKGRAPASEVTATDTYVKEFEAVERIRKESRASHIAGCELN